MVIATPVLPNLLPGSNGHERNERRVSRDPPVRLDRVVVDDGDTPIDREFEHRHLSDKLRPLACVRLGGKRFCLVVGDDSGKPVWGIRSRRVDFVLPQRPTSYARVQWKKHYEIVANGGTTDVVIQISWKHSTVALTLGFAALDWTVYDGARHTVHGQGFPHGGRN